MTTDFRTVKPTVITKSGLVSSDITIKKEDTRKLRRAEIRREAATIAHSFEQIEVALRNHKGSVAEAAKELGVLRQALKRKIDNNPYLLNVQKDIKETLVDNTEQKLYELIDEKNVTAVTFHLRTMGKDRGYTEKNTTEIDVPGGIKNAATLINAMRKGIEGVDEDSIIDTEDYTLVEGEEEEWEDEE